MAGDSLEWVDGGSTAITAQRKELAHKIGLSRKPRAVEPGAAKAPRPARV